MTDQEVDRILHTIARCAPPWTVDVVREHIGRLRTDLAGVTEGRDWNVRMRDLLGKELAGAHLVADGLRARVDRLEEERAILVHDREVAERGEERMEAERDRLRAACEMALTELDVPESDGQPRFCYACTVAQTTLRAALTPPLQGKPV